MLHVANHERNIEEQLLELRVLLKDSNDFRTFCDLFDDKLLKQFIRGKKYDTQKASEYLQHYLHIRTSRYADFARTLRPSITPLIDHGMLKILKNTDRQGRIVLVDRVRLWDISLFDAEHGIRAWVLFADEMLRTFEASCDTGVVGVLDFADYSYAQARVLTPSVVLKGMQMIVNSLPMRYKAMHFINHGHLVNLLVMGVKPFLKKKMRSRIHTHSTKESLHEYIMPDILPTQYGGSLSDEEAFDEELQQRIFTREEFYENFAERIGNKAKA